MLAQAITVLGLILALAVGAGAAVLAWRRGLRAAVAAMAGTLVAGGVLAGLAGLFPDGEPAAGLALTGGALWLLLCGIVFYGLCLGLALRAWSRWRGRAKAP